MIITPQNSCTLLQAVAIQISRSTQEPKTVMTAGFCIFHTLILSCPIILACECNGCLCKRIDHKISKKFKIQSCRDPDLKDPLKFMGINGKFFKLSRIGSVSCIKIKITIPELTILEITVPDAP